MEVDKRIKLLKNTKCNSLLYRHCVIETAKGKYIMNLSPNDLFASPFVLNNLIENIGDSDALVFQSFKKQPEKLLLSRDEIALLKVENNLSYKEYIKNAVNDSLGNFPLISTSNILIKRSTYLSMFETMEQEHLEFKSGYLEGELYNLLFSKVTLKIKVTSVFGLIKTAERTWQEKSLEFNTEQTNALIKELVSYLEIAYYLYPEYGISFFKDNFRHFHIEKISEENTKSIIGVLEKYRYLPNLNSKFKIFCAFVVYQIDKNKK